VHEDSTTYGYSEVETRSRAITTAQLMGQVMFLVAVALGVMALGSLIGRELDTTTARICSFAGLGMLLAQAFGGRRFRVGAFAIGWLYGIALLIGLGIGPVIGYLIEVDPGTIAQAAGGTALTVLGMGALGFAMSKDVSGWMKPLSIIVLIAVGISIVGLVFGGVGSLNPIISLVIFGASALLIMVDFNYLRKHGTEDDTIWLATGIFVSIVNIFLSLLNLLGDD
jgi:modulator of FtsH protease